MKRDAGEADGDLSDAPQSSPPFRKRPAAETEAEPLPPSDMVETSNSSPNRNPSPLHGAPDYEWSCFADEDPMQQSSAVPEDEAAKKPLIGDKVRSRDHFLKPLVQCLLVSALRSVAFFLDLVLVCDFLQCE